MVARSTTIASTITVITMADQAHGSQDQAAAAASTGTPLNAATRVTRLFLRRGQSRFNCVSGKARTASRTLSGRSVRRGRSTVSTGSGPAHQQKRSFATHRLALVSQYRAYRPGRRAADDDIGRDSAETTRELDDLRAHLVWARLDRRHRHSYNM
jgi:hypothetical protein